MSKQHKAEAILELVKFEDGMLWGQVFNHPNPRLVDGSYIHTSKVLHIDFLNMVAETENTFYFLVLGIMKK